MTSTAPAARAASLTSQGRRAGLSQFAAAAAVATLDEYGAVTRALSGKPVQPHPFDTIDDVKSANARAGFYFFSPDTLAFFESKILGTLYGHGVFVTSERNFDGTARLYTVRVALPDGSIETVDEFQGFATAQSAKVAARRVGEVWGPIARAYWAPHVKAQRDADERRRDAAEARRRGLARLSEELGAATGL